MLAYNYNFTLALSGVAMNTTITGPALKVEYEVGYAIQVVWTGTPTGTFKLQASTDPANIRLPIDLVPVNWDDITDSPEAVSAAGSFTWNVRDVMYNWVRLVYTDGSAGASTAVVTSAVINGKGV